MAGRTASGKAAFWRGMVDRQANSGLTIRQFCSAESISEPSFYGWRRKLNGTAGKGAKGRSRRKKDNQTKGPFIPLSVVDVPASLELLHPLGYRIRLTGDVSTAILTNVLEAIEGSRHR